MDNFPISQVNPLNHSSVTTILTGWWLSHPSEKYELVNWDDFSIPNSNGKIIQSCSSHHQADDHQYPSMIHYSTLFTSIKHYHKPLMAIIIHQPVKSWRPHQCSLVSNEITWRPRRRDATRRRGDRSLRSTGRPQKNRWTKLSHMLHEKKRFIWLVYG